MWRFALRTFLVFSLALSVLSTAGDLIDLLAFGQMPSVRSAAIDMIGSLLMSTAATCWLWNWPR